MHVQYKERSSSICRVRFEIKGFLVWDYQRLCVVSLSKTLYPLLSTGSAQEERKTSLHDWKIADWGLEHQHLLTSTAHSYVLFLFVILPLIHIKENFVNCPNSIRELQGKSIYTMSNKLSNFWCFAFFVLIFVQYRTILTAMTKTGS